MDAGELIKRTRERHRISQQSLALRAGTDQAAVSRIERGEVSPSVDTVARLLAAMGERLTIGAERFEGSHDPVHLRAALRRAPAERLELVIALADAKVPVAGLDDLIRMKLARGRPVDRADVAALTEKR